MKNNNGLLRAILSISLLTVMAGAAMAPALGAVSAHFADQSRMTIQLIVSLPALFIIVTNLMFRQLCKLMRTRTLALVGLALYVVAGAGCFLANNIAVLLGLRALLGVSVGMIMPLSTGLLAYYFAPEEQSRLMGLSAAMNQMGGVVATLLAGLLATVAWNYAFLVYAAGLPVAALVAAKLPNVRLVGRGEGFKIKTLLRFYPSVTAMLLLMMIFFVYPTNFALAAQEAGVGTVATTIIMVGLDLVAFGVGLLFAKLMKVGRVAMKYAAPLLFAAGYGVLAIGGGVWTMIVGSVLIGLANGCGVPYINTIAGIKGGRDAATTVMPLVSAALYAGQFLSPIVVRPLAEMVGGSASAWLVAVGLSVLFLVQTVVTRRHHALPPA
ncbi:MAG: MFS transporter [Bacteroidales bacterium]|nr:MFS transporter [Bacteroidales bacterium]